ncbi:MAG: hypothetical protein ACM32O_06705 [Clostridia bacterium]
MISLIKNELIAVPQVSHSLGKELISMGMVDFKTLPWELFLYGIFIFLGLGSLFCFGIVRIFQGRPRAGAIMMVSSVVIFAVSMYYVNMWYF